MKKIFIFYMVVACFISGFLHAKVLIITHYYNRPDFVQLQYQTLGKFLRDDFEFVVFNDATNDLLEQQIYDACAHINIRCIKIPQEGRTSFDLPSNLKAGVFAPSRRHAEAIHYSLDVLGFAHDGIVMIMDSDLFLTRDFSPTKFMQNYDMADLRMVRNKKINSSWAGLMFFRMNSLPNKQSMQFYNGLIDGSYVDTGGFLYYYFRDNPMVNVFHFQDYRHYLDSDLRSYYLDTESFCGDSADWFRYFLCSSCKNKKVPAKKGRFGAICEHQRLILQNLGFDEHTISCIENKKLPGGIEFVLKDIFIHYQEGSNYNKRSKSTEENKTRLFKSFIEEILAKV